MSRTINNRIKLLVRYDGQIWDICSLDITNRMVEFCCRCGRVHIMYKSFDEVDFDLEIMDDFHHLSEVDIVQ
jgi:hypothetical protein